MKYLSELCVLTGIIICTGLSSAHASSETEEAYLYTLASSHIDSDGNANSITRLCPDNIKVVARQNPKKPKIVITNEDKLMSAGTSQLLHFSSSSLFSTPEQKISVLDTKLREPILDADCHSYWGSGFKRSNSGEWGVLWSIATFIDELGAQKSAKCNKGVNNFYHQGQLDPADSSHFSYEHIRYVQSPSPESSQNWLSKKIEINGLSAEEMTMDVQVKLRKIKVAGEGSGPVKDRVSKMLDKTTMASIYCDYVRSEK